MESRDRHGVDNAEPCQTSSEGVLSHRHQKAIKKTFCLLAWLSFRETTEQVAQQPKKSPRFSEKGQSWIENYEADLKISRCARDEQEEGPAYNHVAHQAFLKHAHTKLFDLLRRVSFFVQPHCLVLDTHRAKLQSAGRRITFPLKYSSQFCGSSSFSFVDQFLSLLKRFLI